jgi:hypothetical protein
LYGGGMALSHPSQSIRSFLDRKTRICTGFHHPGIETRQ